jgi:peptide chain release factor 1
MEEQLEVLLIPKDENDMKNVIMEIRGAAGGSEGNIFAGDLFEMYSKYALNMGYKIEVINSTPGSDGGYAQIEFMVKGNNSSFAIEPSSGSLVSSFVSLICFNISLYLS